MKTITTTYYDQRILRSKLNMLFKNTAVQEHLLQNIKKLKLAYSKITLTLKGFNYSLQIYGSHCP